MRGLLQRWGQSGCGRISPRLRIYSQWEEIKISYIEYDVNSSLSIEMMMDKDNIVLAHFDYLIVDIEFRFEKWRKKTFRRCMIKITHTERADGFPYTPNVWRKYKAKHNIVASLSSTLAVSLSLSLPLLKSAFHLALFSLYLRV